MVEYRRVSDERAAGVAVADEEEAEAVAPSKDGKSPEREFRNLRASDIEPYTGLRYLSTLFRFMAVILLLLLVAEVITGIYTQGAGSIPTLLGEVSRLVVLAGVLWGTGDLALLLIDVGHDVRATRILASRVAHAAKVPGLAPPRAPYLSTPADRNGPADLGNPDADVPPIP